jgi:hypothetical protein
MSRKQRCAPQQNAGGLPDSTETDLAKSWWIISTTIHTEISYFSRHSAIIEITDTSILTV